MPPERSVFQLMPDTLSGAARDLLDRGALLVGQIAVPAQVHQHLHGELGISVLDFRTGRIDALGQQVVAVAFHAEAGAEGQAALD